MFCVLFGIWWTSWTNRAVFNSVRNTWLLTLIIMPESSPAARVRAALSGAQGSHKMEIRTHAVFAFENVSSVLPLVTGLRSTYTLQLLAKYSAGINSKMIHCCEVCTYGHLIRQKHLHFFIQKNHTFAFHKDLEKKNFLSLPSQLLASQLSNSHSESYNYRGDNISNFKRRQICSCFN